MGMAERETSPVLEYIRHLTAAERFKDAGDAQLLGRFAEQGDEDASVLCSKLDKTRAIQCATYRL
jgi:hypothetical protein